MCNRLNGHECNEQSVFCEEYKRMCIIFRQLLSVHHFRHLFYIKFFFSVSSFIPEMVREKFLK